MALFQLHIGLRYELAGGGAKTLVFRLVFILCSCLAFSAAMLML